jgi:hypothetical protein
MEREPFFVRSLEKGGGVTVLDSSNRHYFNQMINIKKVPNLVYLDENMDIIGTMELNPQEAEVYVEQKLEDLVRREDLLIKREAELMQKEFELTEREQKLNITENTKNNSAEIVKIDKRSKEYKESIKEN